MMTVTTKIETKAKTGTTALDVAVVGNPNTGKTSVFNALTGLRQKVANYPGVTVEKKTGTTTGPDGRKAYIHDLPGLYSLIPKSMDDQITVDVLSGHSQEIPKLDLVIVVADASNLYRNLYLVTQVIDFGYPVVLALNMMDAAEKNGLKIDLKKLSQELGIPIVATVASRNRGIVELREQIFQQTGSHRSTHQTPERNPALQSIRDWFAEHSRLPELARTAEAVRVVSSDLALRSWINRCNGDYPGDLTQLVRQARTELESKDVAWQTLETDARYARIGRIFNQVVKETKSTANVSQSLDRVLTHRVMGLFIFVMIFAVIFQTIFTWAEVPMNAIETGIAWFGGMVSNLLPSGVLSDLLVDGAIAGVGAILVFLPQILFLFFFLSLLEDTGYMARVSFMLDRLMKSLGLTGRSAIPLLSSFACAVPGIMATRTIQNWRDRLITIMIAPLMSCSARLPVYTLMIGAFIPSITILGIFGLPGLTLLAMYLIGIIAAIIAALVLNRFLDDGKSPSSFVMELPPYRLPSLKWTLYRMIERAKIFVTEAGKIILAISIVLWFLASYPKPDPGQELSKGQAIAQSYAGKFGHMIEPAIEPLGFDWKIGIGLITSFAAREVLVSTLATIYNVEETDETTVNLKERLKRERDPETGEPVYTPLVALSLMVFFVLACQCMSTVAVVKRETNSWSWPIIMVVYMTAFAYLGSLFVYQGGKFIGLG